MGPVRRNWPALYTELHHLRQTVGGEWSWAYTVGHNHHASQPSPPGAVNSRPTAVAVYLTRQPTACCCEISGQSSRRNYPYFWRYPNYFKTHCSIGRGKPACKNQLDPCSHFDTKHACDKQTRTCHSIYTCWRSIVQVKSNRRPRKGEQISKSNKHTLETLSQSRGTG